ncbi:hypothetical protein Tco_0749525 [Tanacetum coccineum]|uniref:Uncharacterized protein n=1 Tax=Tanacetum coccineum TaxID=301880 RepID=A0ABQ4YYM8_9ASTR
MQKNVLKQQFENFSVSDTEGLDKAYDRFQKLISQLEIHGAAVSNEDANQKFLRALPSSWNNIALIMRNKEGIDELDIDDLYNNLKVFEADIKGSSGSSSNSQNVAFLSAEDTNSINEVNTANGVSTAAGHSSQGQASSSSYTNDLMFSFFADQSNGPQLDDEDLEQIDQDNLEEMDIKWQVAMLSMRVKRFYKKTGRKLIFNEATTNRTPRNQGNRNGDAEYRSRDNTRRTIPVGDKVVHKELGDRMERAATTASSFEAKQESAILENSILWHKLLIGKVELTATIDGQVKTITKASLRRHLKLEDNGGVTTLPNSEIFEQLALMGVCD